MSDPLKLGREPVELGDGDAAVVWRSDGSMEMFLPEEEEDGQMTTTAARAGSVALVMTPGPGPLYAERLRLQAEIYEFAALVMASAEKIRAS